VRLPGGASPRSAQRRNPLGNAFGVVTRSTTWRSSALESSNFEAAVNTAVTLHSAGRVSKAWRSRRQSHTSGIRTLWGYGSIRWRQSISRNRRFPSGGPLPLCLPYRREWSNLPARRRNDALSLSLFDKAQRSTLGTSSKRDHVSISLRNCSVHRQARSHL